MNDREPERRAEPMTGAEWARQEHLAMLGASTQARLTAWEQKQALTKENHV